MQGIKSPETPFLAKRRAAVPESGHLHSISEVESLARYPTRHFTVSRWILHLPGKVFVLQSMIQHNLWRYSSVGFAIVR